MFAHRLMPFLVHNQSSFLDRTITKEAPPFVGGAFVAINCGLVLFGT